MNARSEIALCPPLAAMVSIRMSRFSNRHREDAMAGKGKKSKRGKKLIKTAKKEMKKEEKVGVDRSDVKPTSPFST